MNGGISGGGWDEEARKAFRQDSAAGLELQRQDKEDPKRGPIVRQVRAVHEEAYRHYEKKGTIFDDFDSFEKSFAGHFGQKEAWRYRLYHLITGSTPPGTADLFDAEGEWSIAAKMRELAEKYHVDIE